VKMRASCAKPVGYITATVCIPTILLFVGFHEVAGKTHAAIAGEPSRPASVGARASLGELHSKWIDSYGNLPLSFEENLGQTDSRIRFLSHGSGYELLLTPQESVLSLRHTRRLGASSPRRGAYPTALRNEAAPQTISVLRVRLERAAPAPQITGLDELPGRVNYFIGKDPKKWRTGVRTFARVKYHSIYPGVDLIFYGNQHRLEHDFVVAPGADPNSISLDVEGARKLRIDARGNLVMSVSGGEVDLQKPVIYQEMKGERREITGGYVLAGNHRVKFAVSGYDRSRPLTIDPVLNYSTYLGGSATGDTGFGIAVDSNGDAFVAGQTFSTNFPTTSNAINPGLMSNANGAVFVTELNPTGTTQMYSTYLAGSGGDAAFGIALDPLGSIYVTGQTFSKDFPTTTNGLVQSPLVSNTSGTAFLSVIGVPPDGRNPALIYSSYLGGTNGDSGRAVAADAHQNAYVTGVTLTPNLTAPGAFQSSLQSNAGNAFLARIDTTQSGNNSLVYFSYLGGTGAGIAGFPHGDEGFGVAVDAKRNAYVTGTTTSIDFPTTSGAFHPGPLASNPKGTAFVTRIDTMQPGPNSLAYSTYLGGSGGDSGSATALGPNNIAYITGTTSSTDFPTTPGAFHPGPLVSNPNGTAFVTRMDTTQSGSNSLAYSTYLGGTGGDKGLGIQTDANNNAYVAGQTASTDFPLTLGAFQTTRKNCGGDAFISKLSPGGNGLADLLYSTFFGGSGPAAGCASPDSAKAIALDSSNNAYITGSTASTDFPVAPKPGAFQTALNGTADAFIAKLPLVSSTAAAPSSLNFGTQLIGVATPPQTVTLTNNSTSTISITLPFSVTSIINPPDAADFSATPSGTTPCGATLPGGSSCTINVAFTPSTPARTETATLSIFLSDPSSPQKVSLSGTGATTLPVASITPASLSFGGQLLTSKSAAQTVTLTNKGNAALQISQINIVPSDFTQTNTCGTVPATLNPNSNCTFSVLFAPTGTGSRTGSLSITDNANASPQTVALSGTGWDFTFTAAPTSLTVTHGSSGNFTVTMTPVGGFTQAVSLACSGQPMNSTCTISPTSVTSADGVAVATATVTIATKGWITRPGPEAIPPISMRRVVPALLAIVLLLILPFTRRFRTRFGLGAAMLVLFVVAGCSSGPRAPTGTSTITVTGSSGSVKKTITASLTVS
jgi:Beta-propeller repeat/Abnormal spindle-like microcephaly-assoc'd, ASPM-SPD-2-Hydin